MLDMLHELMGNIGSQRAHAIDKEIGLQIELTIALRQKIGNDRVFCERNIRSYCKHVNSIEKKEIDISINDSHNFHKLSHAIELKYPTNKQVPEQLFKFVKDIRFLEQIKSIANTSNNCYFIALCGHEFYNSNRQMDGIYAYFRADGVNSPKPLTGNIERGTRSIHLDGNYQVDWHEFAGELRYAIIEV